MYNPFSNSPPEKSLAIHPMSIQISIKHHVTQRNEGHCFATRPPSQVLDSRPNPSPATSAQLPSSDFPSLPEERVSSSCGGVGPPLVANKRMQFPWKLETDLSPPHFGDGFWEPPSPFSSKNLHDVDAIIAILFYNQKSFSQQENPTLGHQMVPSTSQDTVLRSATRRLPSLLSKKAAWRWLASLLCELPPHEKKNSIPIPLHWLAMEQQTSNHINI